jgi:hypothetical protein
METERDRGVQCSDRVRRRSGLHGLGNRWTIRGHVGRSGAVTVGSLDAVNRSVGRKAESDLVQFYRGLTGGHANCRVLPPENVEHGLPRHMAGLS